MDAIIPVKSLVLAKTRLAHMLTSSERRGLALAMLEDVLASLQASNHIERIYVVGRDPDALRLVQAYAAEWLFDSTRDLNSALRLGAQYAYAQQAKILLLLHADVPLISTGDLERLAHIIQSEGGLVLAPSRDGGTNALACRTPVPIPLCFGRRSLAMHLDAARRRSLHTQLLCSTSLRDIDRPEDLLWLMEQHAKRITHTFVQTLGLIERAACA